MMIKQLSSTSLYSSPKKGFILLEFCIALFLALLLAMLLNKTTLSLLHGWQTLRQEQQLDQAQSYMFNLLEYELAQNGSLITIAPDGQQLSCKSIHGNKTLSYTHEYLNQHHGLYVTIRNAKGYSKNPIFIPGCELQAWQAEALNQNQLLIQLVLTSGKRTRRYYRVLCLLNGKVYYE